MKNPVISVIVPVYNAESYLERCLESLLNQTFSDIEIILVDDGSKDNSGRICDAFKVRDSRIKVIHQKNSGAGFARNNGLKIAAGKFVSFVDSDDYIELDTYRKIIDHIGKNNAETCIFGYNKVRDDKIFFTKTNDITGTFAGKETRNTIFLNVLGAEPSFPEDYKILWLSPCLSLYSLDIIRKHRVAFPSEGEFVNFCEDFLFNIDYYFHASIVTVINEAFYYYCDNKNSSGTAYNEKRFRTDANLYLEVSKRLKNYITDADFLAKAQERLQRTFLSRVRNCVMYISAYLSYGKGRRHIKEICDSATLREVLRSYPWQKNPFKYRLFNKVLKMRWILLLYVLGKFKK